MALESDPRIRPILNEALDEALRVYIVRQFTNWLHDPSGVPQERARAGAQKALKAYTNVRKLRGDPASVEHVRMVFHQGLDRAITQYIVKLFGVYLSEGITVTPSKDLLGARQKAIDAYLAVYEAIDKMVPP